MTTGGGVTIRVALATALLAVVALPAAAQLPQGAHAKYRQLDLLSQKPQLRALEVTLRSEPSAALAARARSAFAAAPGVYDLVVVRLDIDAAYSDSSEVIANGLEALADDGVITIAHVEGRAERAGALIALSAQFITLAPEAAIGCTEHRQSAPPSATDIAWLSRRFGELARRNGHDRDVARAMVDPSVQLYAAIVDGEPELVTRQAMQQTVRQDGEPVCGAGVRLLLSAADAERFKLSVATIVEPGILWDRWSLDVVAHDQHSGGAAESMAGLLSGTLPMILLLALGLIGIYIELITPGLGLPGLVGSALLAMGLYVQWASGAATMTEVMIVVVGLLLLMLEVTVVPGFGIVGIAGLFCIGFGSLLCLQSFTVPQHTWQQDEIAHSALTLMAALGTAVAGGIAVVRVIPHVPLARRLALASEIPVADGYVVGEPEQAALVGRHGLTLTPLRPTGKIEIDGALHDVVCDGEFLDKGTAVAVREVRGNRIVVEPLVRM